MDSYNLQVMLKDGSIADYLVQEYPKENKYEVLKDKNPVAVFKSEANGGWLLAENPGNIDAELEERIASQLNGYRR